MSVYVRKTDSKWVYDFQLGGVRFCGTIEGCKSKRAAKDVERDKRTEARQQIAAARESRAGPMTVTVAFDRFWTEVGEHYTATYRKTVWTALGWMLEELGAKTLIRDIGSNKITEIIARRRGQSVKPATVNRTVTELLRRILIRADRKWEQDVQKIDWSDLMLAEPKERIRELRDHEETKVFASMRDDYRPALSFFIASGCRLMEVVGLRWSDVDWAAQTITIRGKGRAGEPKIATIPMSGEIRAILAPLRGHHPEFVFTYVGSRARRNPKTGKRIIRGQRYPISYSGMKSTWRRHGGPAVGLDDFRLHDMRHTAATRLLRDSGNLKLVQKLLRHEDITTTAKYAHADDADLRAAMDSVSKSRMESHKEPEKSAK